MNPTELHSPNNFFIKNAHIYNGLGGQPFLGSVAIRDQHITAIGNITPSEDEIDFQIIDATGLVVAPGFINMLSWACESLLADGRSQSDLRQGVTLEVMGEGFSYGPLNDDMRAQLISRQTDFQFDIPWNTLDEYLEHLVQKGVSCNVASFVGTDTLRTYVIGYENRPASLQELQAMRSMARQAMQEGAVGVSSALAYVPDSFHSTDELIALASIAAEFDGLYIAHMRGEGNRLLQGIDEMITIAEQSGARVEIYHLKVAGWQNWEKIDAAIDKIESARARGLTITANIYPYHAAASGLDLTMPAWVQEGGLQSWIDRLKNPSIRQRLIQDMNTPSDEWENALLEVQDLDGILFTNFRNPNLNSLVGKTLREVSAQRNSSSADTIIDLIIEDESRVGVVYFTSLEDNLRRLIQLPYVSVCSDARSMAPEGVFLKSSTHPRAYGSFARFLGKYTRDEKLLSLEEAIRRITHLPASNLRLKNRGVLQPGAYADLVIFDPEKIQDHATFTNPQQYATGIHHVLVNGKPVIFNGAHTGAMPGQVIRP